MGEQVVVKIIEVEDKLALYCHYRGQTNVQPCFIELDLEDGKLSADYDGEIGGAVPFNVWHRRALRWEVPLMTADAVNGLMEAILPLAQRIFDGAEIEWDGSNLVGVYDADADAAIEEIERICATAESDLEVWEASEWLGAAEDELGVTADMDDDALDDLAEEIWDNALDEGILLEDTLDYLRRVRNALREEEEDED
jgi:hypothetical protein